MIFLGKESFLDRIEERLQAVSQDRIPFSEFLEKQMDKFDYSYTSLAKKVVHRVERKGQIKYIPVTRQAIGAWLKGSMPSSREIYVSLGLAFEMNLEEINYVLLENYMGYGLYCKNIDDALWIAVINGLFPMEEIDQVKSNIEKILVEESEENHRSMDTIDLWELLAQTKDLSQLYEIIGQYRDEFRQGAKRFGQCLEEVIQEEYGYFDKAAWFLRDIGCLHCEAQFSKIRAGKAFVTREWLLRFCIALQPSLDSIEKLLAKAQMAPLGITPVEIIIEMIAAYKADSLANSQEVWMFIETAAQTLMDKGYEINDDLCRKYNSVYELPTVQKWWISICIGKELKILQSMKDYGYEKAGYARYAAVDRILFDDVNKIRKNVAFKNAASRAWESPEDWRAYPTQEFANLAVDKKEPADILEIEKFQDYCFLRKPNKFSKDVLMNDIYFYCALLYSIWTGKCYQKDFDRTMENQVRNELAKQEISSEKLIAVLTNNLSENVSYQTACTLDQILDAIDSMKKQ